MYEAIVKHLADWETLPLQFLNPKPVGGSNPTLILHAITNLCSEVALMRRSSYRMRGAYANMGISKRISACGRFSLSKSYFIWYGRKYLSASQDVSFAKFENRFAENMCKSDYVFIDFYKSSLILKSFPLCDL